MEPDGPLVYPSITTVAGMRHKEYLQGWYASMAGKRAVDMFAYLNRNPDRAGAEIRRVCANHWGTRKKIAAAAEDHSKAAADFGTLVHALCEDWERSGARPDHDSIVARATAMRTEGAFSTERDLPDLLRRVGTRLDGFAGFLDDYQPEFVEIEQTVVNQTVGYAGTTDCLVRIGGAMLSGDIKTSKRVHGDYALQGVAVVHAENLLDNDGTLRDMPELTGAFIIHLPEAGGYRVVPLATTEKEFAVFCALRAAWAFDPEACALQEVSSPKELLVTMLRAKGGLGTV